MATTASTSWLHRNLAALTARQPRLAELLAAQAPDPRIHLEETRNGQWTGVFTLADGKPQRLASRFDPRAQAARSLDGLAPDYTQNQLHLGFGLGYPAELLRERLAGSHLRLIVCERHLELLRAVLSARDLRPLLSDPRVHFFTGPETRGLFPQFWEEVVGFAMHGLCLSDNPAAVSLAPEWYHEVAEVALDAVRAAKVSLHTKFIDGRLFLENCLRNAPLLAVSPPARDFMRLLRGKPVIVVAAGPSLDKNVHLLKHARDRAFILCVDTSYRNLTTRGIVPHAVVCIDARDNSLKHFKGIAEPTGARLIFDPESNHLSVSSFAGPRLTVGLNKYHLTRWLDEVVGGKGQVPKGSNVMLAAFQIAQTAGAAPIILIGCDLAYPRDGGTTHAGQTAFNMRFRRVERDGKLYFQQPHFDDASKVDEFEVRMVEGVDGQPVPTIPQLYTYLSMLESEVGQKKSRVIDATEGGARIRGTELLTLAEALERECPAGGVPLPEALPEFAASDRREAVRAQFTALAGDLERSGRAADEGTRLCERVEKAWMHDRAEAMRLAGGLQAHFHSLLHPKPVETLIESGAASEMFQFLKNAARRAQPDVTPEELVADFRPAFAAVRKITAHFHALLAGVVKGL